jgi:uncharacterized membrane protein
MNPILVAGSIWLHAWATVVLIGYYVFLSLVYVPIFRQHLTGNTLAAVAKGISTRSRPWIGASVLIFIVTGIYLMLIDTNYLGVGNFGNAWSIVMLIKHVLVLVMIGAGIYTDRVVLDKLAQPALAEAARTATLKRYTQLVNGLMIAGVFILLLTALAQVV